MTIEIEKVTCSALLDTGATVSTISADFYDQYLSHIEIHPLDEVLHIECADGQNMPYSGYISVSIKPYGTPHHVLDECLLLIVPKSNYNARVPVLIGTNIISRLIDLTRDEFGTRYLQDANLHTPWYLAFRCLALRQRELCRHSNRLCIIKSAATERLIIPPNGRVTVDGYMDKKLPYHKVLAMLQPTGKSIIHTDLDITPSLQLYDYQSSDIVPVEICNVTTRTVAVPPRAVLCELQPVQILNTMIPEDSTSNSDLKNIYDKIKISPDVTEEEEHQCKDLVSEYPDIFSTSSTDIGTTDKVKHRIELYDTTPFKQKYRRIPPAMIDEVRTHIQELLASGVIRASHSPFSSNVVLVRKHDGSLRLCIDYRQLNSRTVKDNYALPRVDEILDSLSGNRFFTVLDMKSGYHQIEIEESHKERTAFTVGTLGFYEFNKMSFGLANAPATYQRLQEECLGDLHLKICYIYLDDLIIFSRTFEEHLARLRQIFDRIRQYGLKLSPKKCSFLMNKVKYIGHIVSEEGVQADPDKVDKVRKWPTPKNPEEVRSFLGFVGYYRKFIENFSKIARPLIDVMATGKKSRSQSTKQHASWKWGQDQERAFNVLKDKLTSPPILGYPDFSKPFELHTDACGTGLGAVLYQKQNGHNRVIAYASRGLTKSERNYPTHKLEFLALKWAITEKFSDYLLGQTFSVFTDNNPLTYVLTSAKLDATGHRWIAALSAYNFTITYKPGKSNSDADGLSRVPEIIDCDTVKAICNLQQGHPLIESLPVTPAFCDQIQPTDADAFQRIDLHDVQQRDAIISTWKEYVRNGSRPKRDTITTDYDMIFHRNFKKLRVVDDLLVRVTNVEGREHEQVVVSSEVVSTILEYLHDRMGHPGRERTTALVMDRFYWPRMRKDIANWVDQCDRCLKFKTPNNQRASLVNISTTQPLELVCMDFLTLEPAKGGIQNILVITDHFTKFAVAVPTKNQTAKTTADALLNHFIIPYGLPRKIHSDQGTNFSSKLIQELCQLTGITKSRTTPYHPMGNGITERFNRTLISMLGTLAPEQKSNWKAYIGPLIHAYNATKHETTGFSPFYLMFGREPNLPVDLIFGLNNGERTKSMSSYVQNLKERLNYAYTIANTASKISQSRHKTLYDSKTKGVTLSTGDRVLVKVVAYDGKHKIADRWEDHPYVVISQPITDIPVYKVSREDGEGRCKTLHRNLLFPIGTKIQSPVPVPAPRTRVKQKRKDSCPDNQSISPSSNDVDDDDESEYFVLGTGTKTQRDQNVEDAPLSISDKTDEDDQGSESVVDEEEQEMLHILDPEDHPEVSSVDETESEKDHSVDETEAEFVRDPSIEETETDSEEDSTPPKTTQRVSTRNRVRPKWTEDYVMSQQVQPPEWLQRANYLQKLATTGVFDKIDKDSAKALVTIVTGK